MSLIKSTPVSIDDLPPVDSVNATARSTTGNSVVDRMNNQHVQQNILHMTKRVAATCNFARTLDNIGFNRYDAHLGHQIAQEGFPADWNTLDIYNWCLRLTHYRKQLDCENNFWDEVFGGE